MVDTTNIQQLGQIIEPSAVKFSFAAPGWYALGGVLLLIAIIATICKLIIYAQNKYRRSALKWLGEQEILFTTNKQYAQLVYTANMLMKRVAMLRYGRAQVAALRDEEWFNFLNKKCKSAPFSNSSQLSINKIYTSTEITQAEAKIFLQQVKIWIQNHKYDAR